MPRLPAARHWLPLALVAILSAPAWSAPTLGEALQSAWERAMLARLAEAQHAEAKASRGAAESPFPAAPSISLSQRDDRFNRGHGARERELEVTLPLWLPGQRSARVALAERESATSLAGLAAARLAVAGELRRSVWAYASARAEAELARQSLDMAKRLEQDVARREAAGELARTDLLLALEEALTAHHANSEADLRERQALSNYRMITGLDEFPLQIEEALALQEGLHPRLQLLESASSRSRAEMQLVRTSTRDSPELSLGLQQSRESFADANRNTIRLGIRIPFSSTALNEPRIAAASAGLIRAEAEMQQAVFELEAAQRNARAGLENAQLNNELAQARLPLVDERLRLQERAFALGELGLAELLRTRNAASQARYEATRARLALAAAHANLNQALGVLP